MDEKELVKRVLDDPILFKLSSLARKEGVPFYLVGGYLRDLLLGVHGPPRTGAGYTGMDYDFALPKEFSPFLSTLEKALQFHFFKAGKVVKSRNESERLSCRHGRTDTRPREEAGTVTYRMIRKGVSMDVTLFQGETLDEDLLRRDFTINAMALSLCDRTFRMVQGALDDIKHKCIRAVSPRSIDEDPLRMLRAIRYLCTLRGFTMDIKLEQEITSKRELIRSLPGERVRMELDRILLSPRPHLGIKSLYELGLLFILIPELSGLENLGQGKHHHLNVFPHILLMADKISWALEWAARNEKPIILTEEEKLALYYAALFHDLGKQDAYSRDERGTVHFYHHESFSCERAKAIMERLRFSNPMKNSVLRLVQYHMRILNLPRETGVSALKRLVNLAGDHIPLLVLHTLADKEASRGILSIQLDEIVEGHCLRLLHLFGEKDIVHPPSFITGHDVMALGYPSGPKVGEILDFIREKQVEGEIRTREEALQILKERFEV